MIRFARLPKSVVESDDEKPELPADLTLYSFLPLGVAEDGRATVSVDMNDGGQDGAPPRFTTHRDSISSDALQNIRPFLPVRQVTAAGGVVVRDTGGGAEILMIRRRGEWDLPKGKQDVGESIQRCALREVTEEVGASNLEMIRKVGTTSHGYRRRGFYMAKRTHWYLMSTTDANFSPQTPEEIVAVAWMELEDALRKVGYPSLKTALARWMPMIAGSSRRWSSPRPDSTV